MAASCTKRSGPLRQSIVPTPPTTSASGEMPKRRRVTSRSARARASCTSSTAMNAWHRVIRSGGTPWSETRLSNVTREHAT